MVLPDILALPVFLILKPLLKNSESKVDDIELPFDMEISLSMIESGCLFVSLNQMATLIIISTREKILQLNNINKITFNFELIERPEFPSVGMHIDINTVSNNLVSSIRCYSTVLWIPVILLDFMTSQ